MKKTVIAAMIFISPVLSATPYIGIGYQANYTNIKDSDIQQVIVDDKILNLEQDDTGSDFKLTFGYLFNAQWALEASYYETESSAGIEEYISVTEEEEWDAEINAKHISLTPVYRYHLNDKWGVKANAGLIYSDYTFTQSHEIDVENGADINISGAKSSKSELGGTAGIGIEHQAYEKVYISAEYQFSYDSVMSLSAVSLNLFYRF